MANQEWLFKSSASILAATAATNDLTTAERTTANGMAWLVAKHKELEGLDRQDAVNAFEGLDKNVQESLKSFYSDANYNTETEDGSFLGTAGRYVTDFATSLLDGLGAYGEWISTPYRAARVAGEEDMSIFDSRTWAKASDGNRLFDASLEAEINRAYSQEEKLIAKQKSMGISDGEILSGLESDKEFRAFERYLTGKDDKIMSAIRDYDDAKISWGRDLARTIGLNPDIGSKDQGAEGRAYDFLSGLFDFTGDVVFDPLTYVATPLKGLQMARFGVMSILAAEAGALTGAQKALQIATLGKMKFGIDAAFDSPGVSKVFDEIGGQVKILNSRKASQGAKAIAVNNIKELVPQFDDNVITQLKRNYVYNSDAARNWFRDGDKAEAIMSGQVGTMQFVLPRHTAFTEAKRTIRRATESVFLGKPMNEQIEVADSVIETLSKGQSLDGVIQAKKIKAFTRRHASMIERATFGVGKAGEKAMIDRSIFVSGKDELGRSLAAQSGGSIYTLARTVLGKQQARMIQSAFVHAKDSGQRRNIVSGLYKTIAVSMGIDIAGTGKSAFEKTMRSWEEGIYGEAVRVTDDIKGLTGVSTMENNLYNTGMVYLGKGQTKQMALAVNQLADQAVLPDLSQLADLMDRGLLVRATSNVLDGRALSSITDAWSALNLLPRLGLRSVIDENAFHYLTIPAIMLPRIIEGYQSSIVSRIVTRAPQYTKFGKPLTVKGEKVTVGGKEVRAITSEQKDIGIVSRLLRPMFVNVEDSLLIKAQQSVEGEARMIEEALTRGLYGRVMSVLGRDVEGWSKTVADHVRFGLSKSTDEFTRGISRSQTTGTQAMYGIGGGVPEADINLNIQQAMKDLRIDFGDSATMLASGTPEFKINYLIQLNNRVDRNANIGKLAVAYMDNPDEAVTAIANYLKSNKSLWQKFERSAHQSPEQAARDMYLYVRNVFTKADGTINQRLVDKVKVLDPEGEIVVGKKKYSISTQSLTLEDIEDLGFDVPTTLMGYRVKETGLKDLPHFMSQLIDRGFQIADRQVATLSREPVFYAYLGKYRKDLRGLEQNFVKKFMANNEGATEEFAREVAARRYAYLANDMALNRTLGYVDNPNVRSNIAFSARNLARYYRATEDFYRRAGRTVRNNPQALVRLRMTVEGLDHAGFIYEDENGEKYFNIPVDEITYGAYGLVVRTLTGQWPNEVMPLNLSGKVKMLAPSFDPQSALPTFSSPLASVSWALMEKIIPIEYTSKVSRALMGPYAEGRDLGDALLPSMLRRFAEVSAASLGHESEQVSSATMKAGAFYTANGMGPGPDATIFEIESFKQMNDATARNMVAIRNILGIISPVTPGISETNDIPEELLDLGTTSFRAEFQNLVEAERKKGNINYYDTALIKWTRLYPGKLAYTVSESETDKVATIQKTKEAVAWVKKNKSFVGKHPEGSLFLAPMADTGFDIAAYSYLKAEGFIKRKELDQYFMDIANVWSENTYEDIKTKWAERIQKEPTTTGRQLASNMMDKELDEFLSNKPYLKLKFESFVGNRQYKTNALEDVRRMVESPAPEGSEATVEILRNMVKEYDRGISVLQANPAYTDSATDYRKRVRTIVANNIAEIAGSNPNAIQFYKNVLKRLLEQ